MKLRRKGTAHMPRRFARSAVLLSTLIGASFGCMESTQMEGKCVSAREAAGEIVSMCSSSEDLLACIRNMATERTSNLFIKMEKTGLRASQGDEVFSTRVETFALVAEYKLTVRSIDKAGVEFSWDEERYSNMNDESRKRDFTIAIFRMDFDGTMHGDTKLLEGFGVQDFSVARSSDGTVRVSFVRPLYCEK